MYEPHKFGDKSLKNLEQVHPALVELMHETVKVNPVDFSIVEGLRTLDRQRHLVSVGASKTLNSRHLRQKDGYSHAVDVAPYPIDWQDTPRFYWLAGGVLTLAIKRGLVVRWGGDWDMDGTYKDQTFHDLGHFELRNA